MIGELDWQDVSSSHIARIAYAAEDSEIYVEFNNGAVWKYPGDAEDWESFQTAESKGRFVAYFFKGKGARIQ